MALRGLTVNSGGQLLLNGARFRNIGLNYPGAINPIYSQPSATACAYTSSAEQDTMLAIAASMGVKVLRVKATPFYPAQWRYGVNGGVAGVAAIAADREAHYVKIDQFIAKCAALGIGVILNLFFRHTSITDLAGQTTRAGWLNSGATRTYVTSVTQEIVTRYLTTDYVYGYEWSNEVNNYNDATDATRGSYPAVNTTYGTAASYSAANDIFLSTEFASVVSWWYGIVTAIDNQRIVLTGNGSNSYTKFDGTAGVSFPMVEWNREQYRDNPTNCGSIHFYQGTGFGSKGFKGLNPILTGVRHWQKSGGRGFVLGEVGCQPWTVTAASGSGAVATFTTAANCPLDVGDGFIVKGTTGFDGTYKVATIDAGGTTVTAASSASGSWSGSVKGIQTMDGTKTARVCSDIINSGCDLAMFWMIDGDAGRPILESVHDAENAGMRAAITAANAIL